VLRAWWPDLPVARVTGTGVDGPVRAGAVLVGTTALLHRSDLPALDLVVVDEQQRFSRGQREALAEARTHLLEVTATCIPRTQALVTYGVVAVDRLTTCHVRRELRTRIWTREERAALMEAVRRTVAEGGQVLALYPRRDQGATEERAAVAAVAALWERQFPGRVQVVHGGQSEEANAAALEALRRREADVLVATTVVEVGVDLPGLRRVVVVHAERFGLAQLHQIRGRVARTGGVGWCDLYLPEPVGVATLERLEVLVRETDGYRIAEADLRQRGAGELVGEAQSGMDRTVLLGRPLSLEALERARQALDEEVA